MQTIARNESIGPFQPDRGTNKVAGLVFCLRSANNALTYDCAALRPLLMDPARRRALMAEWSEAMRIGPGVVVLRQAEADHAMLDRATAMFFGLIDQQNRDGTGGGDHFAKPGANDRIWNSLEKHCLSDQS